MGVKGGMRKEGGWVRRFNSVVQGFPPKGSSGVPEALSGQFARSQRAGCSDELSVKRVMGFVEGGFNRDLA